MDTQKLPKVKIKKINEKAFSELAKKVKQILIEEQKNVAQEEKNEFGITTRKSSTFA